MAYHHDDSLHTHKVRAKKVRQVAFVMATGLVIIAGVVFADWLLNKLSNSNTIVSNEITSTVQASTISVQRTEYYQFQAPDDWVLVAGQSTENKFVYIKKGRLASQRLIVYINAVPVNYETNQAITNVLPVELSELGKFINISEVSEHCENSWPDGLARNPSRIVHERVSVVCTPSSKQYNVAIGEYDKDDIIEVTTSSGDDITLKIVYSNLSANPNSGDLQNIISSFSIL